MALIVPLKTIYSSNNPIEITYLNTGATNDPYVKIEIYDVNSGSVLLYSGVYYHNKEKIIYTDLSPIINGLVSSNDFKINSTETFYKISSAFTRLNIKLFTSVAGIYSEDIGSNFCVVFNESLYEEDFLKTFNANLNLGDNKPIEYISANQFGNDNYIYSGQGCVGLGLTGVTDYLGDRIPSITLTNFVYDSSGNDYLKLTKNNVVGNSASYVSMFNSNEFINNFSIGDDIYLHLRMNYSNTFSDNVAGDIATIKIQEYQNTTLVGESTKNVLCVNGNQYFDHTIKHTIVSDFTNIKIVIESVSRINTEIRSTHWYLGKSYFNTFEPNISQIWGYKGQETNGSGRYPLNEFICKDFILNEYNQFYSIPNNVNLPYSVYSSRKKKIDTLRGAPLNVQFYYARQYIPLGMVNVSYHKEDAFGNIDYNNNQDIEIFAKDYLHTIGHCVHNINIGHNAVGGLISSAVLKNYNTIKLDLNLFRTTNIKTAFPTYGRSLLFNIKDKECYNGNVYQLYWTNRRGGIDHIIMGGNNVKSLATKSEMYKTNWRKATTTSIVGDMSTIVNHKYNINSETSYQLNSQILSELDYNRLYDLITSPKLWLYDAQLNETYSVDVDDTNFTGKQFRFDKMFNFTVKVTKQITNNRTQY